MHREGIMRGNRRGGFNDNAKMFSFSVAALNFSFNPGSENGKVKDVAPVFRDNVNNGNGVVGSLVKKDGMKRLGGSKNVKKASMKKLIREKSAEMSPYCISKADMPFINSLKPWD
ncbi:hypothetical protein Hanom_Chr02g00129651 [Helianthus anomalus]